MRRIVLDTNVIIAALRSTTGASHAILEMVHQGRVVPLLSVPLLLEYEEVAKRPGMVPHLSHEDIDAVLDLFASRAVEQRIWFTWRPFLADPDDDMLVELAMAGSASHIVTGNLRHLLPACRLGIEVVTPREFLSLFKP